MNARENVAKLRRQSKTDGCHVFPSNVARWYVRGHGLGPQAPGLALVLTMHDLFLQWKGSSLSGYWFLDPHPPWAKGDENIGLPRHAMFPRSHDDVGSVSRVPRTSSRAVAEARLDAIRSAFLPISASLPP
jgi:hypothetical protein